MAQVGWPCCLPASLGAEGGWLWARLIVGTEELGCRARALPSWLQLCDSLAWPGHVKLGAVQAHSSSSPSLSHLGRTLPPWPGPGWPLCAHTKQHPQASLAQPPALALVQVGE